MTLVHYAADVGSKKIFHDFEARTHDELVTIIVDHYGDWNSDDFPGLVAVYKSVDDDEPILLAEAIRSAIDSVIESELFSRGKRPLENHYVEEHAMAKARGEL